MSISMRRSAVLAGALTAAVVVVLAAPAAAALPAFGTAPVSGTGSGGQTVLTSVSVGHHAGFDRVVFTSSQGIGSYRVRYVPEVTADASGRPVPLLGSAFLLVTFEGTPWTTHPAPQPTITPLFPALRQVRGAGEFEAFASYGIGQATKAGFRVFRLTGPDRIVVDVKHPATAATTQPAAPPAGTAAGSKGGSESTAAQSGSESTGAPLPNTGFPILPFAGLGLALLLAGTIAVAGLRRRAAG